MIDFKTIRAAVPTIQAARDYGLDVGRNGMARCPFHDDHKPSLKLDDRFYCFGCGATGNVIDFTARYFGITPKHAAQQLCRDYELNADNTKQLCSKPEPAKTNYPNVQKFRRDERLCVRVLDAYEERLLSWKEQYAPEPGCDIWDPRFCEALKELSTVTNLLDCLCVGTLEQRVAMVDFLLGSGWIAEIQMRLRKEAIHG